MYWLKSCPRCKGDLAEEDDIYGKEIMCVQCGFRPAPVEMLELRHELALKMAEARGKQVAASA